MRIFSTIVAVMMLFVTVSTEKASADIMNTETNTISKEIAIASMANNDPFQLHFIFNSSNTSDVRIETKTPEEIRYDNAMDKWKSKQSALWNQLPKESFTINASAYTASADECGNSKGITASGMKVKEHQTLACPPNYPFGTKIAIEGYGTYTCEDRGGAIKGNHFDVYMKTKKEAFAFGRRTLTAQVVQ